MATAIVKSIGTAGGRDYSTFAAFEAAIPASLVTADETWTGEAYNDSEFTAAFNISGHTTDATRWILVTAAAGESFADHADKLTNALAYDQSKGVGLNVNTGYAIVTRAQDSYVTFSRLQIRSYATLGTTDCVDITAANNRVENCIIDKVSGAGRALKIFSSTTEAVNCLVIQRVANQQGVRASDASRCVNVTCVSPSDVTSTSTGFGAAYTNNIAINCASFGFGTDYSASGWDTTNSKNNASDSTGNPGTASQDSLTFADQFEAVTTTGIDLRVKSGSGLIDNGVRDATYTLDLDIIGQDRSLTTPTIGCWEFVSGGGGSSTITASLDALVKAQGVVRTASLDAILQSQGLTTSSSLDAMVRRALSLAAAVDAQVKVQGVTTTASLDAMAQKLVAVTASLDSVVTSSGLSLSASLDSVITSSGLSLSASLDSLLQKSAELSSSLGALVQARGVGVVAGADALLQKTTALEPSVDAALQVQGVAVSAGADALLQKTTALVSSMDAVLVGLLTVSAAVDAMVQRLGVSVSAGMDAFLSGGLVLGSLNGVLRIYAAVDGLAAVESAVSGSVAVDPAVDGSVVIH